MGTRVAVLCLIAGKLQYRSRTELVINSDRGGAFKVFCDAGTLFIDHGTASQFNRPNEGDRVVVHVYDGPLDHLLAAEIHFGQCQECDVRMESERRRPRVWRQG